jgi:hypothetical protein
VKLKFFRSRRTANESLRRPSLLSPGTASLCPSRESPQGRTTIFSIPQTPPDPEPDPRARDIRRTVLTRASYPLLRESPENSARPNFVWPHLENTSVILPSRIHRVSQPRAAGWLFNQACFETLVTRRHFDDIVTTSSFGTRQTLPPANPSAHIDRAGAGSNAELSETCALRRHALPADQAHLPPRAIECSKAHTSVPDKTHRRETLAGRLAALAYRALKCSKPPQISAPHTTRTANLQPFTQARTPTIDRMF